MSMEDVIKSTYLIYTSIIFKIEFYVNTEQLQKKKSWFIIPYFEMFPELVLALIIHLYLLFHFHYLAI